MTPDPRSVLIDFAGRVGGSVILDLQTPFLMGSVGLMAAVLGMMAEDIDGAAARLVEENRAIRGLFAQAAPLSPPADLAARLTPLAKDGDDDLRISSLQAANNVLRATLIDLQAWAETQGAAKPLNDAIWAELSASTERRRLSTAPF